MRIYARVKTPGRRKDILQPTPYDITDAVHSLRELLCALAEAEVNAYNAKEPEKQFVDYLTTEQIESQAEAGKVSFGSVYSDKKADKRKAAENVLQCFSDGLVRVLMDGSELTELDAPLEISENAEFTFIRLTFLTGSRW